MYPQIVLILRAGIGLVINRVMVMSLKAWPHLKPVPKRRGRGAKGGRLPSLGGRGGSPPGTNRSG